MTHVHGEVHRVIAGVPGTVTLYDQNDDDSGVAVLSTNFTDSFDSYDSYGADDFTVPIGHNWKIRQVEVTGAYLQGGQYGSESQNVSFYKDKTSLPGKLVAECDNLHGVDNQGSFAIRIPKSCKANLKGGQTYWVSVSANMDADTGDWGWETRNSQSGKPAAWENPKGGFGMCQTWAVMTSCIGDFGEGPDFMFTLKGKDIAQ